MWFEIIDSFDVPRLRAHMCFKTVGIFSTFTQTYQSIVASCTFWHVVPQQVMVRMSCILPLMHHCSRPMCFSAFSRSRYKVKQPKSAQKSPICFLIHSTLRKKTMVTNILELRCKVQHGRWARGARVLLWGPWPGHGSAGGLQMHLKWRRGRLQELCLLGISKCVQRSGCGQITRPV